MILRHVPADGSLSATMRDIAADPCWWSSVGLTRSIAADRRSRRSDAQAEQIDGDDDPVQPHCHPNHIKPATRTNTTWILCGSVAGIQTRQTTPTG